MKILVTGGAGYVGSGCVQALVSAGHRVEILDDFSTGNHHALADGCPLHEGEVGDIAHSVLDPSFDAVIHCAARSLVGESVEDPAAYWQFNVGSTLKLLESMRVHGVKKLVFSSTAATYGEPVEIPITEASRTAPTNPYGATKLAVDQMITSYCHAYDFEAISLRYFNVAGAFAGCGENRVVETHLIPLTLQVAAGHRDKISVFGSDWPTEDGTAVRDYIHLGDLADAHVLAVQSVTAGEHKIFNLGSGDGFSVSQVIETCRKVTGHPIPAELAPRRAGDPATLIASSELAISELGWKPSRTSLEVIVSDAWNYVQALGVEAHSARKS